MKLTFLEASNGKQLSKQFKQATVIPYPHVKFCTSHEFDVSTLQEIHDLIKLQANKGQALLKGNLKEPLVDQSRQGKSQKSAPTQLLVLDVDGLTLDAPITKPITAIQMRSYAEKIMQAFPADISMTDYIVQGSASMGMKDQKISIHIYMLLSTPVAPTALKQWLRYQNFQIPMFQDQIDLSANAHALKFPLDICTADNSRIIFITPPVFEVVTDDPFATPDDRIVLIDKGKPTFDITPLIKALDVDTLNTNKLKKLNELRIAHGKTKQRANIKIESRSVDGEIREVISKPDQANITIIGEDWPYIRCNLNGGDSAAYYFNAANPEFLLNFKDEPIFRIKDAAPEFYEEVRDKYDTKAKALNAKNIRPVAFRDQPTNSYYNGIFDPNCDEFTRLYPSTIPGLTNFMNTHGSAFNAERDILEAIMEFNPHTDKKTDLDSCPAYINKYLPSKYMLENVPPATPVEYGQANLISTQTPFIYKLLSHMLGNGEEELERFVNWLAYIFQTKNKSMTAWVLTGVQGTGKGLFYNEILKPLFGSQYVPMRMLGNMEEKFNDYLETALFMVVDEFRMKSTSGNTTKIQDELKNAITEPSVVIRNMRANQIERPSFTNYIFLTNREDAVQMDAGDRRYNIGLRQEVMIQEAHPDLVQDISVLSKELSKFAGILQTYVYDQRLATTCLNNGAKQTMRKQGMSNIENFATGLAEGNIEDIAELTLSINLSELDFEKQKTSSAQRYIKRLLAEALETPISHLTPNEARVIYNALAGPRDVKEPRVFGLLLGQYGVTTKRVRIKGLVRRVYEIPWNKDASEIAQRLIEQYFDPKDVETFLTKRQ